MEQLRQFQVRFPMPQFSLQTKQSLNHQVLLVKCREKARRNSREAGMVAMGIVVSMIHMETTNSNPTRKKRGVMVMILRMLLKEEVLARTSLRAILLTMNHSVIKRTIHLRMKISPKSILNPRRIKKTEKKSKRLKKRIKALKMAQFQMVFPTMWKNMAYLVMKLMRKSFKVTWMIGRRVQRRMTM